MKAFEYFSPRTLDEAVALLAEKGEQACVLPGGTDILVQLRQGRRPGTGRLPDVKPGRHAGSAYLRFIPRNEMDLAVVGAGVSLTLDDRRGRCAAARVALGAVAPTPLLVPEAGQALAGTALTPDDLERAAALARSAA